MSATAPTTEIQAKGYATDSATSDLKPFNFTRRAPTAHDVVINIRWSGICHSDIHTAKGDWGPARYPLVPGHEIVGIVDAVGPEVSKYTVGDKVGVGCFVDSCGSCHNCHEGQENYCLSGMTGTYNAVDKYGKDTAGGYSNVIVVDESYVVRVPDNLDFAAAAPLLCAGITTYSPLRHWGVKKGSRVAVAGLGGLGHMAVKIASAMGAEVTVLSTSERKRADAEKLGASKFVVLSESPAEDNKNYFDLIIDTISATHDVARYVDLLRLDGVICLVGLPSEPMKLSVFPLVMGRRSVAGSLIGGIKETQEMLDFCGKHNITSDIEVIEPSQVNEAWERVLKNDVKYRFVLDMSKL